MKEWIKRIIKSLLVLIIINGCILSSFSQSVENRNNSLALRINGGMLYFLGDLDKSPIKYGAGLGIEKLISPKFSIGGNVVLGNLSGYNSAMNLFFESRINEITLNARAYILELLNNSASRQKLSPYLSFGAGIINYKTDLRSHDLRQPIITPVNKVTAVFPIGGGINYYINDKVDLNFDLGLRIASNDNLDATVSKVATDMYAFISAGIIYRFGNPVSAAPSKTTTRRVRSVPVNNRISDAEERYNKLLEEKVNNPIEKADVRVASEVPARINAGDVFLVNLTIDKGNYNGSLKIEQTFEPGFVPFEYLPGSNSFNFFEPNAIIRWDALPAGDQFSYSYKVKADNNLSGNFTINGLVSYPQPGGDVVKGLKNFISIENEIESQMDRDIQRLIGDNIIFQDTTKIDVDESDFSDIEEILSAFENTKTEDVRTQTIQTPVKTYTGSRTVLGTEYRIQVGAFRNKDSNGFLIRKFNITDPVSEEQHNGWYKYTVGSFSDLNEAKRFRDDFIQRTRHYSSYIIAYKNGVRLKTLPKIR